MIYWVKWFLIVINIVIIMRWEILNLEFNIVVYVLVFLIKYYLEKFNSSLLVELICLNFV